MEDIFFFQKIYLHTNNFDILDFKKLCEYKKSVSISELKTNFYQNILKNSKNRNYTISVKKFIENNNIYIFDDVYKYYSYFEDMDINIDLIDYDYIRKAYEIKLIDSVILKKIYENKIIITNENDFASLFKQINLNKFKYIDLFKFHFNIDENFLKNIKKIEEKFSIIKKSRVFIFYKKIFESKNFGDDDLIFFLILNKFELNVDNFVRNYNDVKVKHKFNNLKSFYVFYFNNFSKFNSIVSEKLFLKLYNNFDISFFKNAYYDLLRKNNINMTNNLDIYNFYFTNNDLLINIDNFNHKYKNINQKFIKYVYLNEDSEFSNYVDYVINNKKILYNTSNFINNFSDFNMSIYLKNTKKKIKNNYEIIKEIIYKKDSIQYKLNKSNNIDIEFVNNYYQFKNLNLEDIYILSLDDDFINNLNEYSSKINVNFTFIKMFNNFLKNEEKYNIIAKISNTNNIIKNVEMLKSKYLTLMENKKKYIDDDYYHFFKNTIQEIDNETKMIQFFKTDIYNNIYAKKYIGRKNVFMIEEVLLDLELEKPELLDGISLIIRAKNEESNIELCIESVVDLVDEIIFVNNNSDDNTLKLINKLAIKYSKIKVYNYFINVNKVGIEHQNALKNKDKNTLGNFYNWCLSKSTMKNVIKWDADFICIRQNFNSMINNLQIRRKNNKYAVWFTGYTLFINKEQYYINLDSFYNEFRLFSYMNDFKWYDGDLCEFNEPYIANCNEKIYIHEPIFYEMKRTDVDEFDSRSSLIDKRDINDFNILTNLKEDKENSLYKVDKKLINKKVNIIIIVNNFSMGGSNFFVIELYKYFKVLGFNVKIYAVNLNKSTNKYTHINYHDVYTINDNSLLENIKNFDYIFLNGFIPNNLINILMNQDIKKIFITHSDVAYSNIYIEKYHNYLYKIVTVNNYTKKKLMDILDIKSIKINKIINYTNIVNDNKVNLTKNKKFGIITRFSEDKNIIMLLYALKKFFNIYNDYEFYLVGYENENIQEYIINVIKYLELGEYIKVEGYQNNVKKYYELFDFIMLPSVSEGTSYNLIESMIYKKLIITSDVGGNYELLDTNCIYIEYENIKEFESKNLHIENYNQQLKLLGYYTINNYSEFKKNINLLINFDIKNMNNIPSIFIKNENNEIDELKNRWNKNVYNIFSTMLKAIKMSDEKKEKIINNNYNNIIENFNKNKYYKNINEILGI